MFFFIFIFPVSLYIIVKLEFRNTLKLKSNKKKSNKQTNNDFH